MNKTTRKQTAEYFFVLVALSLFGITAVAGEADEGQIAMTRLSGEMYHEGWIDFNKNGMRDLFEEAGAPLDARVDDILSRMNVAEKTCQLATVYGYLRVLQDDLPTADWKQQLWKDGIANIDEHINGVPKWRGREDSDYLWPPSKHARALNEVQRWFIEETRLGIPVDFTNEGIRGICHHRATNFPAQIGVGATWHKELVTEIGRVTGAEAQALGYTHVYSPILDLARDPRWGRVVECYGEDPFLVATLGARQVKALRDLGLGSTAKHYAVYSVPKGGRDGNARTDPHVGRREMEQMYLMPFEAAIRDGGLIGVMSSYNDYDAEPVSGSRHMLIDQLRTRMGFRGYVVSDSDAVLYLWKKHRIVESYKEAVRLFLESGGNVRTEFNPPENFVLPLRELIAEGAISMRVIDKRVRDVLRVKFELGLFDQPYVTDPESSDEIVHCQAHREVALQAARESIVLLKNEGQVLPLAKDLESILVCGPNATEIEHSISRYGPTLGEVITVLDGIRAAVSDGTEVRYAPGCHIVDDQWPESELFYEPPTGDDAAMIQQAVERARDVDAIVAVLGESVDTIGESKSRTDLNLTGYQRELVKALQATGKPMVVVLLSGRALSINWIDRHVPSIVEAWFPGEWCGRAVADVLFGDVNPGGKLPITFPRTVGQLPLNFPFKPGSQAAAVKGDPNTKGVSRISGVLYPFGHGLSYTTFQYDQLTVEPEEIGPGGEVTVTCRVTNIGDRAGDEVVQLYLRDDFSSVITYDSVLRGFERISLQPGESQVVSFVLGEKDLELLNRQLQRVVEPGAFTVKIGSCSEDIRLEGTFRVRD